MSWCKCMEKTETGKGKGNEEKGYVKEDTQGRPHKEGGQRASHLATNIPGREKSKYKSFEGGMCRVKPRNDKEASGVVRMA